MLAELAGTGEWLEGMRFRSSVSKKMWQPGWRAWGCRKQKDEKSMLLRQMKYFVAVIDCNSFTEAAEQCYISQSAISQQIQSMEKELGVELIRRGNRRFTITPTGQYFYSHCKAILEQVDELIRERNAWKQTMSCSCASDICDVTAGWNFIRRLRNFRNNTRKWPSIL